MTSRPAAPASPWRASKGIQAALAIIAGPSASPINITSLSISTNAASGSGILVRLFGYHVPNSATTCTGAVFDDAIWDAARRGRRRDAGLVHLSHAAAMEAAGKHEGMPGRERRLERSHDHERRRLLRRLTTGTWGRRARKGCLLASRRRQVGLLFRAAQRSKPRTDAEGSDSGLRRPPFLRSRRLTEDDPHYRREPHAGALHQEPRSRPLRRWVPGWRRTRLHVSIGLREALLAYVGRRSDGDVRYGCSLGSGRFRGLRAGEDGRSSASTSPVRSPQKAASSAGDTTVTTSSVTARDRRIGSLPTSNVLGLVRGVTAITAGVRHSCALTSEGRVKCWGANYDGSLGIGTADIPGGPITCRGSAALARSQPATTSAAFSSAAVSSAGATTARACSATGRRKAVRPR